MSRSERHRYAVAAYTVELRERGWFFGHQYDASAQYRGPYASITSVTLTISRELRREIERRHRASTDGIATTSVESATTV